MRALTWGEFDACVQVIANSCREKNLSGVYGFPRGGLCLAVAISHALNIPFLSTPLPRSLVVDDVYETGQTLDEIRTIPNLTTFVWISKVEPDWWNAVEVASSKEWLLFPWENDEFVSLDERRYRLLRLQPK